MFGRRRTQAIPNADRIVSSAFQCAIAFDPWSKAWPMSIVRGPDHADASPWSGKIGKVVDVQAG